ncbi:WXG100 family type VII secretion target [Kitasatospora sp. NPDC054939]
MPDPDRTPGGGTPTGVALGALARAAAALDSIAAEAVNGGRAADDATTAAATKLGCWETANALRAALTEWHEQVAALNGRLGQEAGMMRQTHANYAGVEGAIAESFGGGR